MADPLEPGDLLRIEEASRIATVKPATIRSWLTQGKLPRVKIGRLTRILRQDLEISSVLGALWGDGNEHRCVQDNGT